MSGSSLPPVVCRKAHVTEAVKRRKTMSKRNRTHNNPSNTTQPLKIEHHELRGEPRCSGMVSDACSK
jgi:hypothetical protein